MLIIAYLCTFCNSYERLCVTPCSCLGKVTEGSRPRWTMPRHFWYISFCGDIGIIDCARAATFMWLFTSSVMHRTIACVQRMARCEYLCRANVHMWRIVPS
jgi:hypothetical protein